MNLFCVSHLSPVIWLILIRLPESHRSRHQPFFLSPHVVFPFFTLGFTGDLFFPPFLVSLILLYGHERPGNFFYVLNRTGVDEFWVEFFFLLSSVLFPCDKSRVRVSSRHPSCLPPLFGPWRGCFLFSPCTRFLSPSFLFPLPRF